MANVYFFTFLLSTFILFYFIFNIFLGVFLVIPMTFFVFLGRVWIRYCRLNMGDVFYWFFYFL